MTETDLRKPFIAALRACGAKVVPYVGSKMGQQGTADVFVAHTSWHGWIEFKGPTTKIQPLQQLFIDDMNKRGVNAVVVRLFDKQKFQINSSTIRAWKTGSDIIGDLTCVI